MITKRVPFALVAASALLLLAGCSGGGSNTAESSDDSSVDGGTTTTQETTAPTTPAAAAGDQSKAEACDIVREQFQAVSGAGSTVDSSDPQATLTAFKQLASDVGTQFSSITNEEIAAPAQKASGALNDYAAYLETVIADPSKASGLSDQISTLQASFTEAATACAG
ncbi:ABC-type glycerol-3-phosphate transport system substrate-binding protein [Microbacterium sp. 1154]|uniref:hypothetical protein n=1 Tax=Microbacterium sp. 1154 TaxID=2817733 RepID=UPI000E254A03|nr:hypothetical protein [Microbacterium sp. 1154]MDR6691068.1 ABC-type glycerol-3-phosphate transport system substrate-binding protein [Microbacterium sp. 1154]